MKIQKEEYVPVASAILRSFSRDLPLFEAENHLYNAQYLDAMRSKTEELRAAESADLLLIRQKKVTQELYALGRNLLSPLKLLNLVLNKAGISTKLASDVMTDLNKRNFEGALSSLESLRQVVSAHNALMISKGMKATAPATLENAITAITEKSTEQTAYQQQRKGFTADHKVLYKELYLYITEVAKLGKIIFEGQQKKDEYTISKLLALMHVPSGGNGNDTPEP